MKTGTLYGIGVGPGDPDLIPLKAVKVLQTVDIVFTAASTKNDYSLAMTIAEPHLRQGVETRCLPFPMTQDSDEKERAWVANAQTIADALQAGQDAAFLTLGDPLTYSTYGYVLGAIQKQFPSLPIVTIPGITSYQASAAALNTPLVEGNESLLIMAGTRGTERIRSLNGHAENVVIMKAYRNIGDICGALEDARLLDDSTGVVRCGMPDQEVVTDIRRLGSRGPDYWTLIIAKRNRGHGPKVR
ncbi:MAG: precorrin-2 C(20)-methyltransferase [Desulfobacterales bacterium]|jgi:precorrin-2/cobalt-factor-2 C20-methyltransferase